MCICCIGALRAGWRTLFIARLGSVELDILKGEPRFSSLYQVPRFVPFVRMCELVCVCVKKVLVRQKLRRKRYQQGASSVERNA